MFTVQRALEQALVGSTLSVRFTQPDAVVIEFRANTERVDVTGRAPAMIASPKFTEMLRDTPQSIDVVTSEGDRRPRARRRCAMRCGMSPASASPPAKAAPWGDNLTIRGFTARNDIFIDGMRDFGSYYRDPFNQDQVQVLKGPSSVAFGRGTTGGVLNQATKTPEREAFVTGTANLGTDLTQRATLDVNEPVTALGDGAAFRLNVMATRAHVAGRDVAENQRYGIAPSLALGLGTPTRATFTLFHQAENDVPEPNGIPWLFNAPAPVARHNYYGFASTNFLTHARTWPAPKSSTHFPRTSAPPTRCATPTTAATRRSARRACRPGSPSARPLDTIYVDRNQITVDSTETFLQNQFDVTSRFRTRCAAPHAGHRPRAVARDVRSDPDHIRRCPEYEPRLAESVSGVRRDADHLGRIPTAHAIGAGVYALGHGEPRREVRRHGRRALGPASTLTFVRRSACRPRSRASTRSPSWRGRRRLQAGCNRQRVRGLRHVVQPVGRSADTDRGHRQPAAREQSNDRARAANGILGAGRLSARAAVFQTEKQNAREPDPNNSLLKRAVGARSA